METTLQKEVTFYQDVNVTQSRYVTNSKTYAMRNISSVHIFEIIKSKTPPIILIILGILMLYRGFKGFWSYSYSNRYFNISPY
ncbi:hypothetical protein EV200_103433 [Pedobacter psychrotolerans]|uniref:Uncharacterized protein n=1 Tax=Pedobacter psychrotolerans TaxID=1843235 RepID=A0A4R2HF40_9SPHI|nr:hypothetical protein EV200_103433 [Pedobacter psychrotolerans]